MQRDIRYKGNKEYDRMAQAGGSIQMSEIKQITEYSKIDKVRLSESQAKKITQQLALDQEAKDAFNYRISKNALFINYNQNPFTYGLQQQRSRFQDLKFNTRSLRQQISDPESSETNVQLPDALMKFRQQSMQRPFDCQIDVPIGKAKKVLSGLQPNENYESLGQSSKNIEGEQMKLAEQLQTQNQLSFQDITSLKEPNYYSSNNQVKNIFNILFFPKEQIIMGSKILDKYFFSYNSMKQTAKKLSVSIYRDISNLARRIITKKAVNDQISSLLESKQLIIENNIHNLLSIASGRSKPEDIYRMLLQGNTLNMRGDETMSNESAELQAKVDNKNNKASLIEGAGLSQDIASEYIKQTLTPYEIHTSKQLDDLLVSLQQTIKEIHKVMDKNIFDKKTIMALEKKKKKQLIDMTLLNKNSYRDKEQLIRINKLSKGRDENIKIKAQAKAAILDKSHKRVVKQKINEKQGKRHKRSRTNAL